MRNPKLIWIANGIEAAGGKKPTYLQDIDAKTRKVMHQVREAPQPTTPYVGVVEAWVDAVLSDRDPITDDDVLRAMLNSVLFTGNLDHAAGNIIENRVIEDLSIDVDEIVSTLKSAADKAGQTLADAYAILGDVGLDDIQTVFNMGPEAVAAHQAVAQAKGTLRTIDLAWVSLAELTRFSMVPEFAIRMGDMNVDQWQQARRSKDPWDIVRAGGTVSLAADYDTVKQRQARLDKEMRERAEAPGRAEKEARRAQGQRLLAQTNQK